MSANSGFMYRATVIPILLSNIHAMTMTDAATMASTVQNLVNLTTSKTAEQNRTQIAKCTPCHNTLIFLYTVSKKFETSEQNQRAKIKTNDTM